MLDVIVLAVLCWVHVSGINIQTEWIQTSPRIVSGAKGKYPNCGIMHISTNHLVATKTPAFHFILAMVQCAIARTKINGKHNNIKQGNKKGNIDVKHGTG